MPGPVEINGSHQGPNGVLMLAPGSNSAIHPGHPNSQGLGASQPPPHPPQQVYNAPAGYVQPNAQPGSATLPPNAVEGAAAAELPLPISTLTLTASSPLVSAEAQGDVEKSAGVAALLHAELEEQFERKPEVKAKTTVSLGKFVYPDLPFPYKFDLGGGMVSQSERTVVVPEDPEKKAAVVETAKAVKKAEDVKASASGAKEKEDSVEEGEIVAEAAVPQTATNKEATPSKVEAKAQKDTPSPNAQVDKPVDEPSPKDVFQSLEADTDKATMVDPVAVDIETRVTIVIPHGHLPSERPQRPRIWGGGVTSPFALLANKNTPLKTITRKLLISLLPPSPPTPLKTTTASKDAPAVPEKDAAPTETAATAPAEAESDKGVTEANKQRQDKDARSTRISYLEASEHAAQTLLAKYTPRRIYTDDSDLTLCAIHSGWISWEGVQEAKKMERDLRIEVRVLRVGKVGSVGHWSGREFGHNIDVYSVPDKGRKGFGPGKERREEVVTCFAGGLGERCWSAKGRHGWVDVGEATTGEGEEEAFSNPLNDGRGLMSAAWGTGHDGAAVEVLSARFVEVSGIVFFALNFFMTYCSLLAWCFKERSGSQPPKSLPALVGIRREESSCARIRSPTAFNGFDPRQGQREPATSVIADREPVELHDISTHWAQAPERTWV